MPDLSLTKPKRNKISISTSILSDDEIILNTTDKPTAINFNPDHILDYITTSFAQVAEILITKYEITIPGTKSLYEPFGYMHGYHVDANGNVLILIAYDINKGTILPWRKTEGFAYRLLYCGERDEFSDILGKLGIACELINTCDRDWFIGDHTDAMLYLDGLL